jgi:hypothetical protein
VWAIPGGGLRGFLITTQIKRRPEFLAQVPLGLDYSLLIDSYKNPHLRYTAIENPSLVKILIFSDDGTDSLVVVGDIN